LTRLTAFHELSLLRIGQVGDRMSPREQQPSRTMNFGVSKEPNDLIYFETRVMLWLEEKLKGT
jgi:hypothetical protein